MNRIVFLSILCFLFFGCNFNANISYENEELEKVNAESVVAMFYFHIERNEFKKVLELFSSSFYKISSKEDLENFLTNKKNELGDFESYTLKDWQTHRTEGTNPISEYVLVYEVKYFSKTITEKISLIKEKGKIKICGYDVDDNYLSK